MSSLQNLLVPAVLFFALGFIARIIKSDLRFPTDLAKILSIYLLVSIGVHGGYELAQAELGTAVQAIFWAIVLGLMLPVIAYVLMRATRKVDAMNASAIAAHYGSVSAGTFLTAIAYLQSAGIEYESYPVIMLAIMESPAIIIGILLAAWSRRSAAAKATNGQQDAPRVGMGKLMHEAFTNGSVMLLIGSMIIAAIATPASVDKIKPFVNDIFMGMLCLFLLEMGMEAARRIDDFRRVGPTLVAFGVIMPVIGGMIGCLVGAYALGFSVGGTTLVGILAASASYIAVPPAMRLAVPEANPSLYLTLSLGVTFPFNVLIGIPLYHRAAEMLISG